MPGANQYRAQQFIDAIPRSGGIISTIARRVGCDWHTAKKYIERLATVKQAYEDECERVLDAAETSIIDAITPGEGKTPDLPTAKWYLTMKGKGRGYVTERAEVDLTSGGKTLVVQLLGNIDPEAL